MIALFIWALLLPPEPASRVAAHALGRPDLADEMVTVTRRESSSTRVGVHWKDAWANRCMRENAIRTGWLSERCRDQGVYSPRGIQGLAWAYNAKYLGLGWLCMPSIFDVPIFSAVASVRKFEAVCPENGWCP